MQSVTRKSEVVPEPGRKPAAEAKMPKLAVFLVTRDETLWPQIGAYMNAHLALKQADSVEELISVTAAGEPALVLWDARGQADAVSSLSRLHLHSARFAVIAIDDAANAQAWRQGSASINVHGQLSVPLITHHVKSTLESAQEEVRARCALLIDEKGVGGLMAAGVAGLAGAAVAMPVPGERGAADGGGDRVAAGASRLTPGKWLGVGAFLLVAGSAALVLLRHHEAPLEPTATVGGTEGARPAAAEHAATGSPVPDKAPAAGDEQVDLLIEKAQQAMLERHFIEPAAGSALALYKSALALEPDNGEARQGLRRLVEILFARVQSALDERKIEVALQSLETARSIDPDDGRLSALDQRIASVRAEFGPAQILAAIGAQNFDRAAQLIEEAGHAKTLSGAKLAQLRDDMRRRHDESDIENFVKLIGARLQQDKVIAPRNDSAAYYLAMARAAGATAASLQSQSREVYRHLTAMLHAAIDQQRFADADRMLADMRVAGIGSATIAALQHDLNVARNSQAAALPEQAQYLNAAAVQAQIVEQARDSLESPPAAPQAPEVAEASLTRVKDISIDYPIDALRKNIEGWVELSFAVTADGKVAKVAVLDSRPQGIFEAAAAKALARVRYQPPMQGGKAAAVTTRMRIAFRMTQ